MTTDSSNLLHSTALQQRISQLFNPVQQRAFSAEVERQKSLKQRIRHEVDLCQQLRAEVHQLQRQVEKQRKDTELIEQEQQLHQLKFLDARMKYQSVALLHRVLNKELTQAHRETAQMKEKLVIMEQYAERAKRK